MTSKQAQSTPPSRRVLLGASWADGSARLRIRDDDATESVLVPAIGLHLNYHAAADGPRRCVGHVPFRKASPPYVDCLNKPRPVSRTCDRCAVVEATFASNLHHAHTRDRSELDPAIAEHLRQPNLLYLAGFRDGSIKVGTTTATRCRKRLTEQGAWRAAIVAEADDGFAVRTIEDRVTADLQLPQSVSIGRKLDGMVTPRPDQGITDELAAQAERVHALLAAMADTRLRPATDAWSFPTSGSSIWHGLHRYPLKLESGNHDLEIVEACGRMMVVRRPGSDDTFVADIGRLYGVELQLGDHEPDPLAVQDSLF